MNEKEILYISYDGMTDPLGQSQVLPYVVGLSAYNEFNFTLLSCEKKDRYQANSSIIDSITKDNNIDWVPSTFTSFPPILSKIIDRINLKRQAEELYLKKKFDMVHCRSYVSSEIGLYLKKKYGVKFIFDMRGFWVDERVEGGLWNLKNPFYKYLYKVYKTKEAEFIKNADQIISLTEAGKKDLLNWKCYSGAPVKVIPCSADFTVFKLPDRQLKDASRKELNLDESDLVVSYLGSIGTWYMLEEMLLFFKTLKEKYPNAKFLFVTPDKKDNIMEVALSIGLTENDFRIKSAKRDEVRKIIAASDFGLFFIKPTYSKISSSPTKLGELLAMGLPVICNSKIGDVDDIIRDTNGGIVINDFTIESIKSAIERIPELVNANKEEIRQRAFEYYNLDDAISSYYKCYKNILG